MEIEKLEKKLEFIEQSPAMRALLEESAAKVLQTRQEAAAMIEELEQEAAALLPALRAKVDAEMEALMLHDKERQERVDNVNAARFALLRASNHFDLTRAAAVRTLLGNYNADIDKAIRWFQEKSREIQQNEISNPQRLESQNSITMKKKYAGFSNAQALAAGASYCSAAIKRLEQMRLEPDFDAGEIQALKDGIPNVERLEEYSFEETYYDFHLGPVRATTTDGKIYEMLKRVERLIRK